MEFKFDHTLAVLSRTPQALTAMLDGLQDGWVFGDEGDGTWSPFDIVGHLIHGEQTDWVPRARIILAHGPERAFDPFDRFAQLEVSRGKTLAELLAAFARLREQNLADLEAMHLSSADFEKKGCHPELGEVTLGQLLATWAAHDLVHLGQIAQVMARQYLGAIGPWQAYLFVHEGDG